jgi:hypothetical protein
LDKVKGLLTNKLEEFQLEEYHRFKTDEMRQIAKDAKLIMDNSNLNLDQKYDQIFDLIPVVTKEDLIEKIDKQNVDVLLCRSNGEVSQWDKWLERGGIPHSVNQGSSGRPWAAWIGAMAMQYKQTNISLSSIKERIRKQGDNIFSCTESELLEFFDQENLLRGEVVDLNELAVRIRYFTPAEKPRFVDNQFTLSTIHKAKGLGYDLVVIVEPYRKKELTEEDVKLIYVALTRAKRQVYILQKKSIPFSSSARRTRTTKRLRYIEAGTKYLQIYGLDDFDLETLFVRKDGSIDTENLEKFVTSYQLEGHFYIRPEEHIAENKHKYALYLTHPDGAIRMCAVEKYFNNDLDGMSFGNQFGDDGCRLDLGDAVNYQTTTHPLESPVLARYIGPAGIMVFPSIQGFYPLERATGE